MSKRMNRVALSVLITLAVVAGVYTSVLGASSHAGISRGSLHVTAGLLLDYSHARTSLISLNQYYSDIQTPAQFHDCGDGGSAFDPND